MAKALSAARLLPCPMPPEPPKTKQGWSAWRFSPMPELPPAAKTVPPETVTVPSASRGWLSAVLAVHTLTMPPEMVRAVCERAHAAGFSVAAHVESPEGVRVALENGVDSIEHGAQPDAAITALYKEKGAFQVATLSPALPYALFDRSVSHATYEQQENGKVVFDGIIAMARENLANGIPVGLGTDTGCPYITHYDMWRELCYFVKYCGVTPAFALHTATLLNARLAGIDGETGSIEAGKAADLIVCAKDPLADLSALRTLSMVIKGGYRVEHPAPKKLPEVERELDKFL